MTQNAQTRLLVTMPHLQNTVSDINQTSLSVCQGIIFSSSLGGMGQFKNARSSTRLYCIQDNQQWIAGLKECSDLNWISAVSVMTMSRSVYLSIQTVWANWRTQSLVSTGHISLICFRSSILQKMHWVINGRPVISHVNKSSPVYNWVKWSPERMMFPEGKTTTISMAFPWMFCSFSGLTISHSEAWQYEFS